MADERDPKISQRYRELPGEEPSRELDQAILSAAHRSVDRPHAPLVVPAGRHRWYYSLGAAAVLVLAIAVTVHVEHQQPDPELAVPPAPAPAPAPQLQKVEPAPAAPAPERRRDVQARKERQPVYTPDPAERAMADSDTAAREAAPPAPAAAASRAAPMPRSNPEGELERIAVLRRQGRDEEADKALAEFRKRYPDYVIPDAMKAKVERK